MYEDEHGYVHVHEDEMRPSTLPAYGRAVA